MIGYDERLSLIGHLDELRKRITVALVALVVGVLLAIVFNGLVFRLLTWPLTQVRGISPQAQKITTFSPAEPFMISLKVWVYIGLIVATPVLIYEFWAFVAPAIAPTRRRHIVAVVLVCSVLYLGGVTFGYLIVLPKGLGWLLNFNGTYFNVQNRASDYFSFVAWFLVAFGAVFEMPVLIVGAVRLGLIDTRFLRKNRKWAVLVNAVIAAVATPSQDAFSMIAMWIPLIILYEVSIAVARVMERRHKAAVNQSEPANV